MVVLDSDSVHSGDGFEPAEAGEFIRKTDAPLSQTPLRRPIDRASSTRMHYVGRPGSRRYQRFVNKAYLLQNENAIKIPEDLLVYSIDTSNHPISRVVLDANSRKKWEPFVNITEEKQERLIRNLTHRPDHDHHYDHHRSNISAYESFIQIESKIRKVLLTLIDDEFFFNLDKEISDYVNDADNNNNNSSSRKTSLVYNLDDPYQRMITYGICQYYKLNYIKQEGKRDDDRTFVNISKKKGTVIPTITLSRYLLNNFIENQPKPSVL